jgi:hypothetical protein
MSTPHFLRGKGNSAGNNAVGLKKVAGDVSYTYFSFTIFYRKAI